MRGPDGNLVTKLTWDEYIAWQRWDEFPERNEDPPLTVETSFWYNNKEYLVTTLNKKYVIVGQPDFKEIISNSNFLELSSMPFIEEKSFRELIGELLFEN